MIILENDVFRIRTWERDDAASLSAHANDADIARFMTDTFPYPYSLAHAGQFISMALSQDPARLFAIEVNGEAAGGIGLHPQQDIMRLNAELGYWLGSKFHGRGIISSAIPAVVGYGFRAFDIQRIFARPFGNNIASRRVLEKCGFALEARIPKNIIKNGEMLDELIYAIRRTDQ